MVLEISFILHIEDKFYWLKRTYNSIDTMAKHHVAFWEGNTLFNVIHSQHKKIVLENSP